VAMTMHESPPADLGWLPTGIGRQRLGARLRELRLAQGMSPDEVAGRLGVAASTMSRIETGKAPTRRSSPAWREEARPKAGGLTTTTCCDRLRASTSAWKPLPPPSGHTRPR
jgi:DNA-binding XRE family transcriptional regulator